MEKQDEEKIKEIVENLKVYRGVFVRKTELIQRLEEAYIQLVITTTNLSPLERDSLFDLWEEKK